MASKLLRRSGTAICKVCGLIEWEPDCIVQVGIGGYHQEVDVMQEVWPNAKLIGFEAHPDIAKAVKDSYPGIVRECAISDKIGTASLFFRPRHKDGSSLFRLPDNKGQREIKVVVHTLDELFIQPECYGDHILLWLDCEGGEFHALLGGRKFVDSVEVINIEMTANPGNPEWGDHVETHYWLMDHGFKRLTIHTNRSPDGQYDAIYVRKHLFRPEYCAWPCQIERK